MFGKSVTTATSYVRRAFLRCLRRQFLRTCAKKRLGLDFTSSASFDIILTSRKPHQLRQSSGFGLINRKSNRWWISFKKEKKGNLFRLPRPLMSWSNPWDALAYFLGLLGTNLFLRSRIQSLSVYHMSVTLSNDEIWCQFTIVAASTSSDLLPMYNIAMQLGGIVLVAWWCVHPCHFHPP